MKKAAFLFALLLMLNTFAYASEDGRTTKGVWGREGIVLGRGLLNLVGAPFELIRTPVAETKVHTKAWPITSIPRTITNAFTRFASGAYDFLAYPFVVPATDDLSPLTEPMGLPEYVWGKV